MVLSLFSKFSNSKSKEHFVVVFDIGSASVGGGLVLLKDGESPKIIYSTRKDMIFQEELDFKRFRSSMLQALSSAAHDLEKNGLRHLRSANIETHSPEKIYCTFSSPWHISQTRIVKQKNKEPIYITEKLVDEIIEREINTFKRSKEVDMKVGASDVSVIEKQLVRIKLNGYETSYPYDKKAKEVELTAIVSVVSKKTIEDVRGKIHKVFASEDMEFNSFQTIMFDAARSGLNAPDQFLLVDVSGELTDVSIVRDGVLLETVTFPTGKKNVIRVLAKKFKTSSEEALSMLHLYNSGQMEMSRAASIERILKNDKIAGWAAKFREALSELSSDISIPSSVYIVSDPDLSVFFKDLIIKEDFSQFTMTDDTFSVTIITAATLHGISRFGKAAERDVFIILESVFANKTLKI